MMKFSLYLSKVRHLSKTWIWLLLAAGLAACTGATEPAEPAPLPVETEEARPEPTESTAAPETARETSEMRPPATEAATEIPPSPTPLPDLAKPDLVLPDLGPAPDFTNEVWLNTEAPLNLETLRGKVVLVEFWTFG